MVIASDLVCLCESITYEEFGLDDGTSDLAKVGRIACSALFCKAYAASKVPTLLYTAVSRSSSCAYRNIPDRFLTPHEGTHGTSAIVLPYVRIYA